MPCEAAPESSLLSEPELWPPSAPCKCSQSRRLYIVRLLM